MNKITAVSQLMNGECDSIMHGTSEFILQGEDVVNKRSKKALDMKKMREEGWDTKLLPRWDDAMDGGADRPTLCFLENDGSLIIILNKTEEGDYVTSYGEIFDKEVYGELRPATREEALSLLADTKDAPQPRTKPKPKPKPEPQGEDVPKPEAKEEPASREQTVQEEGIDLDEELPATQDHPNAVPEGTTAIGEGIDVAEDLTTPFDLDEDMSSSAPVDTPPVVKEEACQTKTSTTTAVPKEEDSLTLQEQYVALGLNKDLWGDFCSYCFNHKIDTVDRMNSGKKYASTLVIDYAAFRAKTNEASPSNHESDEVIIDKLEVLVDFALEQEDALAFYEYHNLDKFKLAKLISDATDGRLTEMVTQFYDNMGS